MFDDHIFQKQEHYYDREETESLYKNTFGVIDILIDVLEVICELFD